MVVPRMRSPHDPQGALDNINNPTTTKARERKIPLLKFCTKAIALFLAKD
ncbi:MAG: hypothetical protein ACHBN1_34255 [Heteroscytonema crispum UTEX LB 1556]